MVWLYIFTGQGVAILSTVLNSERAIAVNIGIMRAFVHIGLVRQPDTSQNGPRRSGVAYAAGMSVCARSLPV